MSDDFKRGPQSDSEMIICPHCGSQRRAEACDGDNCEIETEEDCQWCNRAFKRFARLSVTYHTKP